MPRVKRGKTAHKKRERILKAAKGYRWGRKSKERQAKEALLHAWTHAFRDRKNKKRTARRLWQVQINAAARENKLTYSKLADGLKKANIKLDRKILADLARNNPETFKKVIEKAVS